MLSDKQVTLFLDPKCDLEKLLNVLLAESKILAQKIIEKCSDTLNLPSNVL